MRPHPYEEPAPLNRVVIAGHQAKLTPLLRYALQYYSFVGKGVKREKRRLLFIYNIIYYIYNSKYFYLHILLFFKPLCG